MEIVASIKNSNDSGRGPVAAIKPRRDLEYLVTDDRLSPFEQRMAWRISQTHATIRDLAADLIRGYVDECTVDAGAEYMRRFPRSQKNKSIRQALRDYRFLMEDL